MPISRLGFKTPSSNSLTDWGGHPGLASSVSLQGVKSIYGVGSGGKLPALEASWPSGGQESSMIQSGGHGQRRELAWAGHRGIPAQESQLEAHVFKIGTETHEAASSYFKPSF